MKAKSPITTHILDTSMGRPANGVRVVLELFETEGQWQQLASGVTNPDGRWLETVPAADLVPGRYRLLFAVGDYFQSRSVATIFPCVSVEFNVTATDEHYHIPLLLSPFGFTTYRGS